ncbi:MAG TPA: DUF2087 domain-containing protein, partial [Anaerolineae bacterium]
GLLAQQPRSVDELAALLELSGSTVSHHLSNLQHAGLVEARAQQYYSIYSLRTDTLHSMAKEILATDTLTKTVTEDVDQDAYTRKVMSIYVVNGKLKQIPNQVKKLEVILHWLVKSFEPGQHYPEKQVNEILKQQNEDFATLRRELVNFHLLDRKNSVYWRIDAGSAKKP